MDFVTYTLATPGGAQPLSTPGGAGGTVAPGGAPAGQQAPPPALFGPEIMFILIGFFVLMIVLNIMAGRKQRKQRIAMLGSLARQDKVRTTSGIIGTIVEMKNDEVVLKVDEATNTKIRFVKSAVDQVITKGGVRDSDDDQNEA